MGSNQKAPVVSQRVHMIHTHRASSAHFNDPENEGSHAGAGSASKDNQGEDVVLLIIDKNRENNEHSNSLSKRSLRVEDN